MRMQCRARRRRMAEQQLVLAQMCKRLCRADGVWLSGFCERPAGTSANCNLRCKSLVTLRFYKARLGRRLASCKTLAHSPRL